MANRTLAREMQKRTVEKFGEKYKWSLDDCETAIEVLSESIMNMVVGGKRVLIHGFGTFEPKTIKKHMGMNLTTKQKVEVPEKLSVKFKQGKDFKDKLKAAES